MNWIEITTRIGCKNMCGYCPQGNLLSAYTHPKKVMTFDDFSMILSHVNPKTTQIHFSGFSESFLTPGAEDMMIEAYSRGYVVVLYTTLEGFTYEKMTKLEQSGIQFALVDFHEYDGNGFDKLKFDETVEVFKARIKSAAYKTSRIDNPVSRGSNNWEIPRKLGPIRCISNRVFANVVLPNGDLFLCCSDWSLKHRIGNIYENHYDSTEFIKNRAQVISLCGKEDSDVLCRTCEWACS
jgi:pyruvate-formate lyase-activating enzyme